MHLPFLNEPHLTRKQRWLRVGIVLALVVGGMTWASVSRKVVFTNLTATGSCPADLGLLDDAITQWAKDNGVTNTLAQPKAADLKQYFVNGELPACRKGGQITFGTDAIATTCSVHGFCQRQETGRSRSPMKWSWQSVFDHIRYGRKGVLRNECRTNLKLIDGGTQQWGLFNHRGSQFVIPPADIIQFLPNSRFPVCPHGGKYSIREIMYDPVCTLAACGHTF